MTDADGVLIEIGKPCQFRTEKGEPWRRGTIRAFSQRGLVRVDDGDPLNEDLDSNGFRLSSWVDSTNIIMESEVPDQAMMEELQQLRQTAGILCSECGHRFIRVPGEPCLNCFVFSDLELRERFLRGEEA